MAQKEKQRPGQKESRLYANDTFIFIVTTKSGIADSFFNMGTNYEKGYQTDIQNQDGARIVLEKAKGKFPRLQLIWADGGYAGKLIDCVKQICNWTLEIVRRCHEMNIQTSS